MIYYSHFEIEGTRVNPLLLVYDKDNATKAIAEFKLFELIDEHLDSIGYKHKDLEVK